MLRRNILKDKNTVHPGIHMPGTFEVQCLVYSWLVCDWFSNLARVILLSLCFPTRPTPHGIRDDLKVATQEGFF
jgi:hypothetical protein